MGTQPIFARHSTFIHSTFIKIKVTTRQRDGNWFARCEQSFRTVADPGFPTVGANSEGGANLLFG